MERFWLVLVSFLVASFGLAAGLRWFERINLYIPAKGVTAIPRSYGLDFDDVWIRTRDDIRINGWFIGAKASGRGSMEPVVLFFHGNAGNISNRLEKIIILHEIGASVMIIDYRGYGNSEGTPTEAGTYLDAEAAYDYLINERKIDPGRIYFYGESLGCGVAVEMASRHPSAGLIAESGFTSTTDMAKIIFPHIPLHWLIHYRYDNLSKMSRVRVPVLVLHSRQDEIIPFAMGRRLYEAARTDKTFVELKGDHNEGFLTSGEIYRSGLKTFLSHHKK